MRNGKRVLTLLKSQSNARISSFVTPSKIFVWEASHRSDETPFNKAWNEALKHGPTSSYMQSSCVFSTNIIIRSSRYFDTRTPSYEHHMRCDVLVFLGAMIFGNNFAR
jgi:hypothetical protein